jgi:hypothetical protein
MKNAKTISPMKKLSPPTRFYLPDGAAFGACLQRTHCKGFAKEKEHPKLKRNRPVNHIFPSDFSALNLHA